MSRLLWLPDVLRAAGLRVHEVDGWDTRGRKAFGPVVGITVHETQGSLHSTDAGEIKTLLTGSNTARPPIAQLYLSRTGDWHVVAAGRCNHNKNGKAGPNKGLGNRSLLGIEAQHAKGELWAARQYESYVAGVTALVRKLGCPVSRIGGHKEHQPGEKSDPGFDMDVFRRDVAALLAGGDMAEIEHFTKNTHAGMFHGGPSCGRKLPDGSNSLFAKVDHQWALLEALTAKVDALATASSVDEAELTALLTPLLESGATAAEMAAVVNRRLGG